VLRNTSFGFRIERVELGSLSLGLLLLGEKNGVDVGEDTTLGDGNTAQELVELLVVSHGELDVSGHNAGLLVVAGGVAGELKDLGSEVLKHGGKVHGGTSTHTGSVATLLQEAADTSNGELKSSFGRAGGRFLGRGASS
jgi:hypothetical protein